MPKKNQSGAGRPAGAKQGVLATAKKAEKKARQAEADALANKVAAKAGLASFGRLLNPGTAGAAAGGAPHGVAGSAATGAGNGRGSSAPPGAAGGGARVRGAHRPSLLGVGRWLRTCRDTRGGWRCQ